MNYTAILTFDEAEFQLFDVDVEKSEIKNLNDALKCEFKYNDFHMII